MSTTRVVKVLLEHGPMTASEMAKYITDVSKKTIENDSLKLMNKGLATRDDDKRYHLREGVTLKTLETGELESEEPQEEEGMEDKNDKTTPSADKGAKKTPDETGAPLTPRDKFSDIIKRTGVDKNIVPSIVAQFFSGDITSLTWLKQVLLRNAMGFVEPNQARMIITTWAQTTGLPYSPEDFPLEEPEKGRAAKQSEKEPAKPLVAKIAEDTGIGYKVDKDKDGDWVARAGGPLTYEVALEKAERLNAIKAMGAGQPVEAAEAPEESAEGKPPAKGVKKTESLQDYFLKKIIDDFIDGRKGRGEEESPQLKALSKQLETATQTIERMREEREQERFDRIEANIAALASQNPWDDPATIERMRQRLGIPSTTVTDSSPAVQLIKDATERADKNVGRLTGLVERLVLKSDEFRPEEKRTPAEKEEKAGALLDEASRRQRSKDIGKRAFS